MEFGTLFSSAALTDLGKVIAIDLMLAGDNVVIIGSLAAGLPAGQRQRVIQIGVGISLFFLIGFALLATTLLKITGVLFAGGVLLVWVAWKFYRELVQNGEGTATNSEAGAARPKSFGQTILSVVIADLSMSLDNVLAVAGAARDHPAILFIGLALSVTFMGLAANLIAKVIERHSWLAFLGLGMVLWVAFGMITQGWGDLHRAVQPFTEHHIMSELLVFVSLS